MCAARTDCRHGRVLTDVRDDVSAAYAAFKPVVAAALDQFTSQVLDAAYQVSVDALGWRVDGCWVMTLPVGVPFFPPEAGGRAARKRGLPAGGLRDLRRLCSRLDRCGGPSQRRPPACPPGVAAAVGAACEGAGGCCRRGVHPRLRV
jgi:hypothetical protein